jgi:putative heme iron utilization protein
MTGIDRYGFEMDAVLPTGTHPIRLAFNNEVSTPDEARVELVRMVKEARKKATSSNA